MAIRNLIAVFIVVSLSAIFVGGYFADAKASRDRQLNEVGASDLPAAQRDTDINVRSEITFDGPAKQASLGIGLSIVRDWSTAMPFIDLMKQSRKWHDWDNKIQGFDVDSDGWIRSLKPNQTAGTVFLAVSQPEQVAYERVVVTYDGKGAVEYAWSAKKVPELSTHGRDVVKIGKGNHLLKITKTDPLDPIRNIKILIEDHIDLAKTGEIFNPDWESKIEGFYAVRFMDWMNTNQSNQERWSKRPRVEQRTWAIDGVPVEVLVRLANKHRFVPWFNIPHKADELYIERFAQMIKRDLDPALPFYIEHSNEVWNWQYQQAHDARDLAKELWGVDGDGFMQWHGVRTAQMCEIFKKRVFTEQTHRVQCVVGVQTGWHGLETAALECKAWRKLGNPACFTYGIDYIGITSYFSGGLNGPHDRKDEAYKRIILDMASSGAKGLDRAFKQLNSGGELRSVKKYQHFTGASGRLLEQLNYWSGVGDKYGLGLVAYEGGQHITANAYALQENEDVIDFHIAINRDKRMKPLYTDILHAWKDGGGELHMLFDDFRSPSKWGAWGALEHLNQDSSPKYDALIEFNRSVTCWWYGCAIPAPAN